MLSALLLILAFGIWEQIFSYFHDEPTRAGGGARMAVIAWLSWGGISLLAAILCACLIATRVTVPLQRLAQAVRQAGSGKTPVLFEEKGPQEIVTVAQALNQMNTHLAQAASDRAFLLAGISHDLRTPLARLRLEAELSSLQNPVNTKAMIADIETMDRIIGQFLDYGRNEMQDHGKPLDLVELATDIAAHYRLHGLRIETDCPPRLWIVARAMPLRRALANLIDNAMRYAGKDKPLDIRVYSRNQMACIEIADRGPGIPSSEAGRMCRPFTRLASARSEIHGAGLGLAIVDRIVKSHCGRLDLLPRKGGGLRAIVHIPACPGSE